jgi:hypothetical protein
MNFCDENLQQDPYCYIHIFKQMTDLCLWKLKYRQQVVMEKSLAHVQEIVRTCGSFQTSHILFM